MTATSSRDCRLRLTVLEGDCIARARSVGKHLLVHMRSGRVLHSHMMMSGSWHCYAAGAPWRRPPSAAVAVIETGERLAVCYDAPVVELLSAEGAAAHPVLSALGSDILDVPFDEHAVRSQITVAGDHRSVGDLLLDQKIVAGIGNIYRCEALFLVGLHPAARLAVAGVPSIERAILAARELMMGNLSPSTGFDRDFGTGRGQAWVYRRAGRPCRRCGTPVASAQMGQWLRRAYWCPLCQR